MQKGKSKKKVRPYAKQKSQPGLEFKMDPKPEFERRKLKLKLFNKTAIITGGDSGIGMWESFIIMNTRMRSRPNRK